MKKTISMICVFFLTIFHSQLFCQENNSKIRFGFGPSVSCDSKGYTNIVSNVDVYFLKKNHLDIRLYLLESGIAFVGLSHDIFFKKDNFSRGLTVSLFYREQGTNMSNYFTYGLSWFGYEEKYFIKVSIMDHRNLNLQLIFGTTLDQVIPIIKKDRKIRKRMDCY